MDHAREYCESTSIHGFAYWVLAPRWPEKAFWMVLVVLFVSFAFAILRQDVTATRGKGFIDIRRRQLIKASNRTNLGDYCGVWVPLECILCVVHHGYGVSYAII